MADFEIYSGQTLPGASLAAGDTLIVYAGGLAENTSISGGAASIFGAAAATLLRAGASETVFTGATDTGATIGAGSTQILRAGSAPNIDLITVQGGPGVPAQSFDFAAAADTNFVLSLAASINNLPAGDVVAVLAAGTVSGGGGAVVVNAPGQVTLLGEGAQSVIAGTGGLVYDGASNANLDLAVAGGNNTIVTGSGETYSINVSGDSFVYADGAGTVTGGTGASTLLAAGSSNLLQAAGTGDYLEAGAGNATLSESGHGAVLFGGSGSVVIADAGSNDTVVAGSGAATIFGHGTGVYVLGAGGDLVTGGASGTDEIVGSTGSATIFGGSADVLFTNSESITYIGEAGTDTIYSSTSSGKVTVFGQSGFDLTYAASGSANAASLIAGAGGETLNASGSSVGDIFYAGSGSALFVGGSGSNSYVFTKGATGGGFDTISGVKTSDLIALVGYGTNEVADALASAVTAGGNTTITLGDGTRVEFAGVTSLSATGFTGFAASAGASGPVLLTDDDGLIPSPGTVGAAAPQLVSATPGPLAVDALILSGGTQDVGATGLAQGSTIEAGGTMLVETGGTALDPVIAGGLLSLSGGASLSGTVDFTGADGTLALAAPLGATPTITGFAAGDVVDLTGLNLGQILGGSDNNNVVTLETATETWTLDFAGPLAGSLSLGPDTGSGTDIFDVLCFLAGTRLQTPAGEIAVEDIGAGQLLSTLNGSPRPVRWLGRTDIATRFADPLRALPIRIRAGALADGLPRRDLLVSPCHALFLGGLLVQAGALVNGVTITRETAMPDRFAYFHVELATHALLIAEGVAAESFIENVSALNFANAALRPALRAPVVELPYPRVKAARQLPAALRQALWARARRAA